MRRGVHGIVDQANRLSELREEGTRRSTVRLLPAFLHADPGKANAVPVLLHPIADQRFALCDLRNLPGGGIFTGGGFPHSARKAGNDGKTRRRKRR